MDHRQDAEFFAVVTPGLETVCAGELTALAMAGVRVEAGGVAFRGRLADLYRANLWLRSASRILVRFADFRCRDFPRLYQHAGKLPWGRFLRAETAIDLRVSCRQSRLMHSDRVRQALLPAIDQARGRPAPATESGTQLILVRIADDVVQISIDSSGELLHRRGYRQQVTVAPLRETLAAGILLQLGWDGAQPLYDPMCGSGTFLIEAALLAKRRAPGLARSFAFMQWPGWRPGLWDKLCSDARRGESACPVTIAGSDRDGSAVRAALANLRTAGLDQNLRVACASLEALQPQAGCGLLVCNPPYGLRLAPVSLAAFYQSLGRELVRAFPRWRKALLCPDPDLVTMTGLPWQHLANLDNGGLRVGLFVCDGEE
ncbi:MAG: class I SAM-dependent RNA methyltransferase [Desulfuromonadales bacterium]|nr:class I SAM-dependent RNA methyltransferase [Desulfuromonadales bacterium]